MLTYNKQYHPSVDSVAVTKGKFFFQPKLTINNPNDQYEREADTIADKVMKMETPFVQKKSDSDLFFSPSPISITPVQRKCVHCEEEEKLQRKTTTRTVQLQNAPGEDAPVKKGEPDDIVKAVTSVPAVSNFLTHLGDDFLLHVGHTWDRSLLGKFSLIGGGLGIAGGLGLAVYAARNNPAALDLMLSPLSGTVIPALDFDLFPKALRSFAFEVNFDRYDERSAARNVMLGVHFDVGRLLPASWGFGPVKDWNPIGGPPISRKRKDCEMENQINREPDAQQNAVPKKTADYIQSLSGMGEVLGETEKSFFEPRFGYDFSNVRIHTDTGAVKSAASINALAYTTGEHIVFNDGQYAPDTDHGKRLLGHELTHVLQQNNSSNRKSIQRFSDTDHHIVEEVALSKVFSEEEIKFIEQGNMQRDYSQMPGGSAQLLVPGSGFGKYKTHEHFDHFIFDKEKNSWVSHDEYDKIWDDHSKDWIKRTIPMKVTGKPKMTPLQYIETQFLAAVEKDMPDSDSFVHLGNAFHTIEDFFAHSNFVELTKGDYSAGKELTTHPSGLPGPSSETFILSEISDPVSAEYFREQNKKALEKASPLSHGVLAKDFHTNKNHAIAITLAALVVRQIAFLLKNAFALKTKERRNEYVQNIIMKTLSDYLRPPSDKDKWWEKLLGEDNGQTSKRIKDMQDKTPTTINQLPGSPLRNFEATRFSSWKAIGLGTSVSIPLKNKTFFTAGYMLYAPGTGKSFDDKIFVAPRSTWDQNDKPAIIFGAQISGSFDVTDLLTRKK
jgi:hypothetical protein